MLDGARANTAQCRYRKEGLHVRYSDGGRTIGGNISALGAQFAAQRRLCRSSREVRFERMVAKV